MKLVSRTERVNRGVLEWMVQYPFVYKNPASFTEFGDYLHSFTLTIYHIVCIDHDHIDNTAKFIVIHNFKV